MNIKHNAKILLAFAVLILAAALCLKSCKGDEFDILQGQVDSRQRSIDSLAAANDAIGSKYDSIRSLVEKRDRKIAELSAMADSIGKVADSYRKKCDRLQGDLAKTSAEIDRLRNNPIRRGDEELIDSFKNKYGNP